MDDGEVYCGGLLSGINAYHIRILTENEMNGGGGYTYDEVGRMTLDQVWHRLCDMDVLKKPIGGRTKKFGGISALNVLKPDKDGMVRGVSADGKPIMGRIGGKSKCQLLTEQIQAAKAPVSRPRRRKRKRGA
jgi:hypothetical protein